MDGGIGVMPTDTVYGLTASASDKQAVKRLYKLKSRHQKPGTIIAASIEQLVDLGIPKQRLETIKHLWPNPLSIVVPLDDNLGYLHQDVGSGAVRVVADRNLRKILLKTGPLLTSSANHPGKSGAANVREAWNYFKDNVDFYVDGGDLRDRAPSTIIRLTDTGKIEVLREGTLDLRSLNL